MLYIKLTMNYSKNLLKKKKRETQLLRRVFSRCGFVEE